MSRPAVTKGTRAELEIRLQEAIDTIRELERSTQLGDRVLIAVARETKERIERELERRKA